MIQKIIKYSSLLVFINMLFAISVIAQELKYFPTASAYEKETGKTLPKITQSPFLNNVKGLPNINERIGNAEVLVVQPYEIGKYGGVARVFTKQNSVGEDLSGFVSQEGLLKLAPDDSNMIINFAKSLVVEKDNKTVHITLRKGVKWSDGVPVTTDDLKFWWDEVLNNKTVNLIAPDFDIKIIDKYKFDIIFNEPSSLLKEYFSHYNGWMLIRPAHYFKKFLPKYNPKAEELAKSKGYNNSLSYFKSRLESIIGGAISLKVDENIPTLHDFVLTKKSSHLWEFTRNPYYWKVDTKGQQLPYIDKVKVTLVTEKEVLAAKISSGQTDWGLYNNDLNKIPIFKNNQEKAHTKVYVWKQPLSIMAIQFNQAYTGEDKVGANIVNKLDFRKAFSYGINRNKINDVLYFGKATPTQMTVDQSSAYYKPEYAKAYAEYAPEKANQLLDKLGYKWNSKHKFRLRPDGEPLSFTIEHKKSDRSASDILEMIQSDLVKIGIIINIKGNEASIQASRNLKGKTLIATWMGGAQTDILLWQNPRLYTPFRIDAVENAWGQQWANWLVAKHRKIELPEGAIEPPQEIKDLYNNYLKLVASNTKEEKLKLGHKILQYQADHLLTVGIAAGIPVPLVIKDNLRNVPEVGLKAWDNLWGMNYAPEIRYFKEPLYKNQKQY